MATLDLHEKIEEKKKASDEKTRNPAGTVLLDQGKPNNAMNDKDTGFDLYIDPGSASPGEIDALFRAFSELNKALGGEGMVFEKLHPKQEKD